MTLVPEWKTCPRCHKKYSWNPDVGKLVCPHCSDLDKKNGNILDVIFGSKKRTSK